jgi:SAM-dependent methyltransferase
MRTRSVAIEDVEGWNDAFARENDIDQYYDGSGFAIRWIEGRRLAAIRRMVAAGPGERILEVGCGGGHVLRLFPGCELTGVDVSGEMLAKARRNLAGYKVRLLKGELSELDLPSGGFDAVICTEVLEHAVDPEGILEQMGRLLRPGGRAVITFPNDPLVNALKSLIRRSGLTLVPPFSRISWGGDHYHLHVWRIGEMRALLGRHFAIQAERFAPSRLLPIRCCFQCTGRR